MIHAEKIAEMLGGERILKRKVRSLADLQETVSAGLPKTALRHCVSHVLPNPREARNFLYKVIPEATYKRRRSVLKLMESERTERLARVVAAAEHVWDDTDESREFLISTHPLLGGKAPIDLARTELGARRVEELLESIFHGLPV